MTPGERYASLRNRLTKTSVTPSAMAMFLFIATSPRDNRSRQFYGRPRTTTTVV